MHTDLLRNADGSVSEQEPAASMTRAERHDSEAEPDNDGKRKAEATLRMPISQDPSADSAEGTTDLL